jgi:hypothetical protein
MRRHSTVQQGNRKYVVPLEGAVVTADGKHIVPLEEEYVEMKGINSPKPKGGATSGGAKRAVSPWILHVKEYAAKHNMTYRDALKDPGCRASYSKGSKPAPALVPKAKKAAKAKRVPTVATRAPRAPSKWIQHVKDFAKRNNVSYGCALSMPECKAE